MRRRRHAALESIERNARAQARLIEDLLEISRIVTGKLRLQVRAGRSRGHRRHRGRYRATGRRWPSGCSSTRDIDVRPALTQGDPDRLQQVVWNLLSNAVKFTPPDGRVTVRLMRKDGYVLTVQDSGTGIEPAFLPHVFDAVPPGGRQRDAASMAVWDSAWRSPGSSSRRTAERSRPAAPGKDTGATFEVFLPSVVEAPATRRRVPPDAASHANPSMHRS